MELTPKERELVAAVQDGLPLDPQPYAAIGRIAGLSEAEVIDGLRKLIERGVIRRFGLVISHRDLGYRANAMVVWDIPDGAVGRIGEALAALPFVCNFLQIGFTPLLARWKSPKCISLLFGTLHMCGWIALIVLLSGFFAGCGDVQVDAAELKSTLRQHWEDARSYSADRAQEFGIALDERLEVI